MSILGSIGKVVGLDDIFGEIGKTARQLLPNAEAQREFDYRLAELQDQAEARVHEQMMAQTSVNKAEASHGSIFVAGWRPFIGWVCGAGLAWNFVAAPLLSSFGVETRMLEIEYLIAVVGTMLGSSGIRTYEKVKGIGRDRLEGPSRDAAPVSNASRELNNEVPTVEENAPWSRS